jgi:hypothetical protein
MAQPAQETMLSRESFPSTASANSYPKAGASRAYTIYGLMDTLVYYQLNEVRNENTGLRVF